MSAVVYARVPDRLKSALQAYAGARALSLSRALVELVERGLIATEDEPSRGALEARLAAAKSELVDTRARLAASELRLQAAQEREQATARTFSAFAERSRQELATCPRCRKPVLGSDLLISGRCADCARPLTSLLVPTRFPGLVHDEYVALLGAIAVLAGLALAASENDNR